MIFIVVAGTDPSLRPLGYELATRCFARLVLSQKCRSNEWVSSRLHLVALMWGRFTEFCSQAIANFCGFPLGAETQSRGQRTLLLEQAHERSLRLR